MNESKYWQKIKNNLDFKHYTRISDKHQSGIPDVNYLTQSGVSGWLELKYWDDFPKRKRKIGLRPEQAAFLHKYSKANGYCFILLGVSNKHILFNDNFLYLFNNSIDNEYIRNKSLYFGDDIICIKEILNRR